MTTATAMATAMVMATVSMYIVIWQVSDNIFAIFWLLRIWRYSKKRWKIGLLFVLQIENQMRK
jgi:hypothetical protein